MNPVQAAADPSSYLIPNERLILPARRHHWITAALPVSRAVAVALLATVSIARIGWLGIPVVVVILIAVARTGGHGRSVSFSLLLAAALGALWAFGVLQNETSFGFLVLIGTVGYAIYGLIDYLMTWIFLTDKRIFRVNGIITRRIATLPLKALTDIRYDRPLIGRYLGYGHFFIESAGQHQALSSLLYVAIPNEFYGVVMEEALGRSASDPTHPGNRDGSI